MSVGLPGAGEVGGFLEPRRDGEERPGLLGEQAGERPVERDECHSGVQQRAGGLLKRDGAVANSRSNVVTRASAARAAPARSAASCS